MIYIPESTYNHIAQELRDESTGRSFYKAEVDVDGDGFTGLLTATLIVYNRTTDYPEGRVEELADLVPVWWEFRTWSDDGEERNNDFLFSNIRQRLN